MTYDQIEKMDKQDLVYAFKRMTEIAEDATSKLKEMEDKFMDRGDDFCEYSHIGYCEAVVSILAGKLTSVVEVLTEE